MIGNRICGSTISEMEAVIGCFHGDSCTYNKLNARFQFSMVIVLHVIRYSFTMYSGGLLSNLLAFFLIETLFRFMSNIVLLFFYKRLGAFCCIEGAKCPELQA